ncbi:MAG TPA: OmpA family protein [Terriglobales bacterium]|nr:OmpA family protein [Terriglobales bacterium]
MRSLARCLTLPLIILLTAAAFAQDGKLKVQSTPKQAYVFVDGKAMGEASRHAFTLPAGEHKVGIYNYGFKPLEQSVTIAAGQTLPLKVTLEAMPEEVPGPRGCITLEGANRSAVLLNGKTPAFFVGHGDEFNHEWLWKQELIVPPGTHQLTILSGDKEVWSGPVEVPANQRVVVDIPKGVRKTVAWPRGERLASLARFKAGTASAAVVVSKPTAQLAATAGQVDCGDTAQLKWTTTDAAEVTIAPLGPVAHSGEQSVKPTSNTTYTLTAAGPGGVATSTAAIAPNPLRATLAASPAEVRFKKVGGKIVEQGTATLTWTTASASGVSIEGVGAVPANGSRDLQLTPRKTTAGPVDETITYALNATNPCGGVENRTATVHLVGSIEEAPVAVALQSVYFPTDYPRTHNPNAGLLKSQQTVLAGLAQQFQQYLAQHPDAQLILDGHADRRGPLNYNQALSERRAEATKQFLVAHGVPQDKIVTRGHSYEQNLSATEVRAMVGQHPELSPEEQQQSLKKLPLLVLASNRRVDIAMSNGQVSSRDYPFKADDFSALVRREVRTLKVVPVVGE